ncbi:hypothetical protein [Halosegnis rubeus]|uniref:hypothetical protein n=1 Tax=Halosegnis rubeus TaxID=2212850 RepID=UPI001CEDC3FF|nr:hypothetical protein [Halosegnis rubeus]
MHTLHRLGESIPFEDAIASLLLTVNVFTSIEWFLDHVFGPGMDVLADLLGTPMLGYPYMQRAYLAAVCIALICGTGAIPRPLDRGYAPSVSDTFRRQIP